METALYQDDQDKREKKKLSLDREQWTTIVNGETPSAVSARASDIMAHRCT